MSENLATRSAARDVQKALLSAAALGCGSLTHSQKKLLLEAGLCYPKTQTSRQETRLTYPNEMLLASLKAYVRHAAQLLSQVDKGAPAQLTTSYPVAPSYPILHCSLLPSYLTANPVLL